MENFWFITKYINKFNCDYKGNIGLEWKHYIDTLNDFFSLMKLQLDEQKVALLFLLGGVRLKKIYESLQQQQASSKEDEKQQQVSKYDKIVSRLTQYFNAKTNKSVEVLKFQRTKQRKNESLESFVRRLFMLSLNCEFQERDLRIIEQLSKTTTNKDFHEELKFSKKITFDELIKLAIIYDTSDIYEKHYKVSGKGGDASTEAVVSAFEVKKKIVVEKCTRCDFEHDKNECPAKGKLCYSCGYMNHFARMCKTKIAKDEGCFNKASNRFLIK